MTKAWRVVLWIVLALLAAGIVLAGAGWLTGASPLRMAEQLVNTSLAISHRHSSSKIQDLSPYLWASLPTSSSVPVTVVQ